MSQKHLPVIMVVELERGESLRECLMYVKLSGCGSLVL